MFQACLGRLLLDTGDPGASAIFRQALQVPTTDFTELLPLSAFFDAAGERELARVAFERGYRDFWEKGNDPRLLTFIITRLIYYGAPRWKQDNPPKYGIRLSEGSPPPELQRELLERFYLFSPHCEWAETAYLVYAGQVLKQGRTEESRLWSARAEEVKSAGLFPISLSILLAFDRSILAMGASITAALLYFLILRARYRPQHRLMRAAQLQKERGVRRFLPFSAAYWSLNQRIGFFTIAAVAWLAAGVVSNVMTCIAKVSSAPVTFGSGSLAGPETAWFLESQLPKSPARDFILAMAYQQDGRTKDAESLYRSLPEFAESWNNLGVLLKNAGRAEEARKAFERALQIDPTLAEAALNLGHRPKTLWTELHEKYLPGRPMMTPPKREQILEAFFGGPITKIVLRTLAGPFSGRFAPGEIFFEEGVWLTRRSTIVMTVLLVVLLAIAASILLLVPAREVTQPPRSTQFLWEILFPGTSPVWSFLGGLVTVAWCCFLLQWIVLFRRGIPYPVTSLAMPNLMFSGVPGNVEDTRRLINPSWIWIYAMPVLLIVLNFILVMRRRRIEASSTSVG